MRNFLFLFLVMLATDVFPGVLSFSYNGQDVTEKAVVIEGKISDESLKASLVIRNTGGSAIQVKVRKSEIKTVSGSQNSFCLGECYPPLVMESPNPLILAANSSTAKDLFYAEYYPNGQSGITEIKYEVFDVLNSANTAWVIISYHAREVTGTAALRGQDNLPAIYPNPITQDDCLVRIPELPIRAPLHYEIISMAGLVQRAVVSEENENQIRISTAGLPNGIYVLSFFRANKLVLREKLVIQRVNNQ